MDIIILAAIAGFLIYRLYQVLGEDQGIDAEDQKTTHDNVVSFPSRTQPIMQKKVTLLDPISEQICAIEPNFNLNDFIEGCEKAFPMIIQAFSEGDKETLNQLLGPHLFKHFATAIDERLKKKEKLEQTIESIVSIQPQNVQIKGKDIFLTVRFVSEQFIVLYDEKGQVIQGNAEEAESHDDLWTFYRKAGSPSLMWQLVATKTFESNHEAL